MTRTYAAKRLLEHGPLSERELRDITGWEPRSAARALQQLLDTGVVTYKYDWAPTCKRNGRTRVRVYALATS